MRRAIVALSFLAFCFTGLACQPNPNAGATAPLLEKGSVQKVFRGAPATPAEKPPQ